MKQPGRRPDSRTGFSLTEVLIAGVVFFVILMVFQMVFQVSTRAEGRDSRRTQALALAAELMEQVTGVHERLRDLPTGSWKISVARAPESFTLVPRVGGELQVTEDTHPFTRLLEISVFHEGQEDILVQPDRAYMIRVRVQYPGPVGEKREQVLVTVRARRVLHKPLLETPPWL